MRRPIGSVRALRDMSRQVARRQRSARSVAQIHVLEAYSDRAWSSYEPARFGPLVFWPDGSVEPASRPDAYVYSLRTFAIGAVTKAHGIWSGEDHVKTQHVLSSRWALDYTPANGARVLLATLVAFEIPGAEGMAKRWLRAECLGRKMCAVVVDASAEDEAIRARPDLF